MRGIAGPTAAARAAKTGQADSLTVTEMEALLDENGAEDVPAALRLLLRALPAHFAEHRKLRQQRAKAITLLRRAEETLRGIVAEDGG